MKKIRYEDIRDVFYNVRDFQEIPSVRQVLEEVRNRGDEALRDLTKRYDGVFIKDFRIPVNEIRKAYSMMDKDLLKALEKSISLLTAFSEKEMERYESFSLETEKGIHVSQKVISLERVGIYVPAGRFPLSSSLVMGCIPAKVAGVKEIAVCSPPQSQGFVHPHILGAAHLCGIEEIYRIGGAQAIAALAFGTESIQKVDKIAGPGNVYVNEAKRLVFGRVDIDFLAGPTELMIVADGKADESFAAADLIAQAEHDEEAVVWLVTGSSRWADKVIQEVERQIRNLPTSRTAQRALEKNGWIVHVKNIDQAIDFANRMAPEHLELQIQNPERYANRFRNYGSLFIGAYAAEVLGDYCSGLNHILPTNRASRYKGGLSAKDFLKFQTSLEVEKNGFREIASDSAKLAESEGLTGHKNSVSIRLKVLSE